MYLRCITFSEHFLYSFVLKLSNMFQSWKHIFLMSRISFGSSATCFSNFVDGNQINLTVTKAEAQKKGWNLS